MSRRELAEAVSCFLRHPIDEKYIGKLERGEYRWPGQAYRDAIRQTLGVGSDHDLGFYIDRPARSAAGTSMGLHGVEDWAPQGEGADGTRSLRARTASPHGPAVGTGPQVDAGPGGSRASSHYESDDAQIAAIELARRVSTSDVSDPTLERLEDAVDVLAMAYAKTPPAELLPRVRLHLGYVGHLLDVRATLSQRRRLLVAAGWCELLAATLHIDLHRRGAADAELTTALQLARQAEHQEMVAWCLETRAWDMLTQGDYRQAATLSQQAQRIAPRGSSAYIQATAQEGRAWARLGRRADTLGALNRTARLVSPLAVPDRPEHHYRYDPGKALAYTATTLAWLGDPAAVTCARDVIAQLEDAPDGVARPRRIASARLDLALALLAADQPDEAATTATTAITSGLLVPSTWWRAAEILAAVERAAIPEAAELRDAFESYRP